MATKKQDVLALLDKAVGKKGPLRIPAYWMREVLLKIMDWTEGLTPDAELATQSYVDASVTQIEHNCNSYTDDVIANAITNVLNKEV